MLWCGEFCEDYVLLSRASVVEWENWNCGYRVGDVGRGIEVERWKLMEGEKGKVGGDIRRVRAKIHAMEGGWRRIARFINRQAASIGEKLAFAIRGEVPVR